MKFPATLVAVGLVGAHLQAASQADEFEFARTNLANFELRAKTDVVWGERGPSIADVTCFGDNQDISFVVDRSTKINFLRFAFRGPSASDGDREQITLLGDTLWLFIDGKKYEYRNIPYVPTFTNRPLSPAPASADEIVILTWRGYQAVQPASGNGLIDLSRIYHDIMAAKRIEWAFKSRNWKQVDQKVPDNALPSGWQTRRYKIDTRDLDKAVAWCSRSVTSDEAKRLPPALMNVKQK